MKLFSTLTLRFVFALGAAHTLFADPLQWELSTLTFSATSFTTGAVSTGTVSGSFTYDADTNTDTTWAIQLSGFPGTPVPASGLLLTPADSSLFCTPCSPDYFFIFDPTLSSGLAGLSLSFPQPLTDAGGTVPVAGFTSLVLNTPDFGTFNLQSPGSVSAVPEPSSAALTLIVSICFGTLFLRRWRYGRPSQQAASGIKREATATSATGSLLGT
jgi:hypothetical protein